MTSVSIKLVLEEYLIFKPTNDSLVFVGLRQNNTGWHSGDVRSLCH